MEWKMIDTAPTDTPVLVWNDEFMGIIIAKRDNEGNWSVVWDFEPLLAETLSHWMPLPKPPVMENNDQWPLADDK